MSASVFQGVAETNFGMFGEARLGEIGAGDLTFALFELAADDHAAAVVPGRGCEI